jgi:transcriptional regulator with XRE-family HTH domain
MNYLAFTLKSGIITLRVGPIVGPAMVIDFIRVRKRGGTMGRKKHKQDHNTLFDVKEYYSVLQNNLLQIRQNALQSTQKDFAARVGVSVGTWNNLETGRTRPTFQQLLRIFAIAANIPPIRLTPQNIAEKIGNIRTYKDIYIPAVAVAAGVSLKRYKKIEAGTVNAHIDDVDAISKALGTNIAEIINTHIAGIRIEDFLMDISPVIVSVEAIRKENRKEDNRSFDQWRKDIGR